MARLSCLGRSGAVAVALGLTGMLAACGQVATAPHPRASVNCASTVPGKTDFGSTGATTFLPAGVALCDLGSRRAPSDPHLLDLAALIPRGRVRQVWILHGGRRPDQVMVEWVAQRRPATYVDDFHRN